MVKRTSFEKAECPIARSLDAIGDWWSLLIIRDAFLGIRRFSEFQKNIGLAKNILTVRLRTLVDQGILKTAPASDGSAYQEYLLTPKGRGIFPILVALRQWSEEFDERPEEIATILVDREKGKPVRKLELYSQDGRLLTSADTALKPPPGAKRRAKRCGLASRFERPTGKSKIPVKPVLRKYSSCPVGQISDLTPRVSPERGAARDRHETRGEMRWTRKLRLTSVADADGEVAWS